MQGAYANLECGLPATPEGIIAASLHSSGLVKPRKWSAISTRARHEKRVTGHLTERVIESFLPLNETEHHRTHNRKAILDLPLFPSYLFVNISPQERPRTLNVSGAVSAASQGCIRVSLPDHENDGLRSGLQLRKVEPHPYLAVGTKAHITTGPFAGMEGVVLCNKSSLRVVLTVDLLMQSVAVAVISDEIEAGNSCLLSSFCKGPDQ